MSIGDAMIGGVMATPAGATFPPAWFSYLHVPDVDASLGSIAAAGGAVCMPGTDIPGIGRFALINDPQGATVYIMTPIGTGPSPSFTPNKPGHVGWNELHTTDWQAAFEFYASEFGWGKSTAMDMGPMGIYQLFHAGGEAIGGIMTSPHMPRPVWLYYFNMSDIDAAKARVEAAGGTVVMGPHEVPGGMWVLQATDPQGAMFGLLAPPKG